MKFFATAATLAVAASSVIAAPVTVEERGLLSGLLGGNNQVTKLTSTLTGVTNTVNPLLTSITSSLSGTDALESLLGDSFLNVTTAPGLDGLSLGGLDDLLAQLQSVLSTDDLSAITSALDNLPELTTGLQEIIEQLLQVVLGLLSGSGAVTDLLSAGGKANILSGLLGSLSATNQLNGLVAQLLTALASVQGLTEVTDLGDLSSLTDLFSAITSPTDTGITGLLSGSNGILSGLLTAVTSLLSLNGLLGGLLGGLGLSTGTDGLSSLLSGLGLDQLLSILAL